jgi:hypothetical protein
VEAQRGGGVDGIGQRVLMEGPRLHAQSPAEFLRVGRALSGLGRQQTRTAKTGQSNAGADGSRGLQKTTTIHCEFHGKHFQKKSGGLGLLKDTESNVGQRTLVAGWDDFAHTNRRRESPSCSFFSKV